MARKKSYEEEVVSKAVDVIMQTIHIASVRIADKYESMIMDTVVERIRGTEAARGQVEAYASEVLNDKLEKLKEI